MGAAREAHAQADNHHTPRPDSPAQVLDLVCRAREAEEAAARSKFVGAVDWAVMHPAESVADAAALPIPGTQTAILLAGEGSPLVAEFAIPELAAALGLSPDAGRAFLAEALECRYRLPRLWARVVSGSLPVWRARSIARRTISLPRAGAAHVDRLVAATAHKIGPAALERLVESARAEFDPAEAERRRREAADGRKFDIHLTQGPDRHTGGTVDVVGRLDLADAMDLETAVAAGAAELAALGVEESLPVRRSMSVGILARGQHTLALGGRPGRPLGDHSRHPRPGAVQHPDPVRRSRRLLLNLHLAATAVTGCTCGALPAGVDRLGLGHGTALVDNTRTLVTAEQVRRWCAAPGAQVVVRPVLDLEHHRATDSYRPTPTMRAAQEAIDRTCVFPWCTRAAARCEADHVQPAGDSGPTCSCNLAMCCRQHHRLKTHSRWRYDVLDPGTYLWTSPHGRRYLRTPDGGTTDVTDSVAAPRPRPLEPEPPDPDPPPDTPGHLCLVEPVEDEPPDE